MLLTLLYDEKAAEMALMCPNGGAEMGGQQQR